MTSVLLGPNEPQEQLGYGVMCLWHPLVNIKPRWFSRPATYGPPPTTEQLGSSVPP